MFKCYSPLIRFAPSVAMVLASIWMFASPLKAEVGSFGSAIGPISKSNNKPNVVLILCDDLGYGDVQCLNPEHGKIKTPRIDGLASQGLRFTDAHSGSSVCTPTRYGLLTGRYSWRTHLQKGVAVGFGPCLIAKDRPTIGSFLQSQGYHTGIIGKWHLNMRFMDPTTNQELAGKPNGFTAPVGATSPDGPVNRGFDYFYGCHHARSMKAIIEQDRCTKHDDEINFLPELGRKCVKFIERRAGKAKPFFLYVPLGSPHTPILPTAEWKGKSGLGSYADFVMQTDDVIGQLLDALDKHQLSENTIVLFSSDNGCSRVVKIPKLAAQGHLVSAGMRGSKADIWEGGHRVPLIVRWPGKIEPNSKSDQLVCLVDMFATVADLLNVSTPDGSCEDSVSFLPAFSDEAIPATRSGLIHHSSNGCFAYRVGPWKLILARGSGGWTAPNEAAAKKKGNLPEGQLYNLEDDIAEKSNRYRDQPEIVERMLTLLTEDIFSGRSTDGSPSANDPAAKIELWKSGRDSK